MDTLDGDWLVQVFPGDSRYEQMISIFRPEGPAIGTRFICSDTGGVLEWDGTEWRDTGEVEA